MGGAASDAGAGPGATLVAASVACWPDGAAAEAVRALARKGAVTLPVGDAGDGSAVALDCAATAGVAAAVTGTGTVLPGTATADLASNPVRSRAIAPDALMDRSASGLRRGASEDPGSRGPGSCRPISEPWAGAGAGAGAGSAAWRGDWSAIAGADTGADDLTALATGASGTDCAASHPRSATMPRARPQAMALRRPAARACMARTGASGGGTLAVPCVKDGDSAASHAAPAAPERTRSSRSRNILLMTLTIHSPSCANPICCRQPRRWSRQHALRDRQTDDSTRFDRRRRLPCPPQPA